MAKVKEGSRRFLRAVSWAFPVQTGLQADGSTSAEPPMVGVGGGGFRTSSPREPSLSFSHPPSLPFSHPFVLSHLSVGDLAANGRAGVLEELHKELQLPYVGKQRIQGGEGNAIPQVLAHTLTQRAAMKQFADPTDGMRLPWIMPTAAERNVGYLRTRAGVKRRQYSPSWFCG